jgi:uncharacterized protein (DUF1697 family)
MTRYIALLRAVNVGGRKVIMTDLAAMLGELGFVCGQTYIASGNALFASSLGEPEVKAMLEARLDAYLGKPVGVMVRTAEEMAAVAAANPFAEEPGNRVAAIFLDAVPPADAEAQARHRADERIASGTRELYVDYGALGMGRSKLVIPAAKTGTARNMNTVATLAKLAAALPGG